MFVSTIIPTVGRETLQRAVQSALEQSFAPDEFEIIVVNDSGRSLLSEPWRADSHVRILNTNCRERSVARNTGAAVAKGRYLHFLDDDDWLLPEAYSRLHALSQRSSAAWLYGSSRLVDRRGTPLIDLHHQMGGKSALMTMAGEWVPLQASLVRSTAFFAAGGFHPLISGPEDVDLLRRITLQEHVSGTREVVACISWGTAGSTTDYAGHSEASRWAREQILDRSGVFQRLAAEAKTARWHGRLVRIYLTSGLWNLRHRRFLTASARLLLASRTLLRSGPRAVLSPALWNAVRKPYASATFEQGLRAAGKLG